MAKPQNKLYGIDAFASRKKVVAGQTYFFELAFAFSPDMYKSRCSPTDRPSSRRETNFHASLRFSCRASSQADANFATMDREPRIKGALELHLAPRAAMFDDTMVSWWAPTRTLPGTEALIYKQLLFCRLGFPDAKFCHQLARRLGYRGLQS